MSDFRRRNVEILADDIRKTVESFLKGADSDICYERCRVVAQRINLIIDAAILEEKRAGDPVGTGN